MNIIIFGAPGSGKGTQSDLIVTKYNLTHLSTGDLLRKEIADNTELGKTIYQYISQGQLVPDKMIIDILAKKLDELKTVETDGTILDGFPRTLQQAEALEKLLAQNGTQTDILIDLHVDEQELITRLLKRGETSGRSDDNIETIKKRLDVYHSQTCPVSDYYKKLGKFVEILGMGTIDDIFGRISKAIDAKL
ncbi:MAG: adenylate kinase [Bacteroidetes bacterium]|nr:adenylate kinase [Bacteroidota bacterium]